LSESVRIRAIEPLGLNRIQAAAFIGVGVSKFDEMVGDGRMPKARRIDGRKVWDRRELTAAFDDLPHEGDTRENPWLSRAS